MTQQVELLRIAAKRLASEKEFMAFALYEYLASEQLTEADLMIVLDCSPENFFRLALCRLPHKEAWDFGLRLGKIAEYTQTSKHQLKTIIERVER